MKKILFIPRRSRIRPYKIAKALKYIGEIELILLCEEHFYDKELFEGVFDRVIYFNKKNFYSTNKVYTYITKKYTLTRGLNRMINIVNDLSPDLIHTFAEPYDHIVKLLKETDYPVVMSDGADFSGISSSIDSLGNKTREQEKYAFENVHGICHKGPEYEIEFYRQHGYEINCP
ncbi:MAG: hypothetical protein ABEH43_08285, partial [Flavobacteriales bacterium]